MRMEAILAGHARRRPRHEAMVHGDRRMSYGDLQASVRHCAAHLYALGVKPGDRVLLYLPNGFEFIQVLYAAFSLGAAVVPVNTRLTGREVAHICADSQPSVVAYGAEARAVIEQAAAGSDCIRLVLGEPQAGAQVRELALAPMLAAGPQDAATRAALGDHPYRLPDIPHERDECVILYTSGTTGKAKGAVNTHSNMLMQSVYMHGIEWGMHRDDRFMVTTPIAHRAGFARLLNAMGLGGTLVIMDRFDATMAVDVIERERISVTGLPPTVIRMMLPQIRDNPARLTTLRVVAVSTESFPVPLKKEVMALLPQVRFHSFLGSSEAIVSELTPEEQITHPSSVGHPLPGVEVRIEDEQGNEVADGEAGELCVRAGPPGADAVMKCYFNNPQATAAAFAGGWYHTGDMARRDADGYLYVVDRKKDMVLSGGFNIYSKEVEDVLRTHPAVADAAVIGVPDAMYGEAVAAFVELRADMTLDAQTLIEFTRTDLAGYKKPKHVWFMPLPRNSIGKVTKNDLRDEAKKRMEAA